MIRTYRLVCSAVAIAAALLAYACPTQASVMIYTYQATGSGSDGPLSAQATVTVGAGTVQIDITNTGSTGSVGQEVSGIIMGWTSPVGSVTLASAVASTPNGIYNFGTGTVDPNSPNITPLGHRELGLWFQRQYDRPCHRRRLCAGRPANQSDCWLTQWCARGELVSRPERSDDRYL